MKSPYGFNPFRSLTDDQLNDSDLLVDTYHKANNENVRKGLFEIRQYGEYHRDAVLRLLQDRRDYPTAESWYL